MLVLGSSIINKPVLSLHIGGSIGDVTSAIINPENLDVIAYTVYGPMIHNDPEMGTVLDVNDVRELSPQGLIIDSSDVLVNPEDVIRINDVMSLNFDLIGLKVVTPNGKKIGKIIDYTLDSNSFMVYQLIVKRNAGIVSLNDPQLTINRSQIIEIDDEKVTIKHGEEKVKIKKPEAIEKIEEFTPNYSNPFRKPNYAPNEAEADNASTTSE